MVATVACLLVTAAWAEPGTVSGFQLHTPQNPDEHRVTIEVDGSQAFRHRIEKQNGQTTLILENAQLSEAQLKRGLPVVLDNHNRLIGRAAASDNTVRISLPGVTGYEVQVKQVGGAPATAVAVKKPTPAVAPSKPAPPVAKPKPSKPHVVQTIAVSEEEAAAADEVVAPLSPAEADAALLQTLNQQLDSVAPDVAPKASDIAPKTAQGKARAILDKATALGGKLKRLYTRLGGPPVSWPILGWLAISGLSLVILVGGIVWAWRVRRNDMPLGEVATGPVSRDSLFLGLPHVNITGAPQQLAAQASGQQPAPSSDIEDVSFTPLASQDGALDMADDMAAAQPSAVTADDTWPSEPVYQQPAQAAQASQALPQQPEPPTGQSRPMAPMPSPASWAPGLQALPPTPKVPDLGHGRRSSIYPYNIRPFVRSAPSTPEERLHAMADPHAPSAVPGQFASVLQRQSRPQAGRPAEPAPSRIPGIPQDGMSLPSVAQATDAPAATPAYALPYQRVVRQGVTPPPKPIISSRYFLPSAQTVREAVRQTWTMDEYEMERRSRPRSMT